MIAHKLNIMEHAERIKYAYVVEPLEGFMHMVSGENVRSPSCFIPNYSARM